MAWAVIGGGVALRLAIAPWGGHPGDLPTLTGWAAALGAGGWLSVYVASDANYPPLGMLLIAAARGLYGLLAPGGELATVGVWPVIVKLPAILADAGIGWLIWRMARGRRGALWGVVSVALNPALIVLSAWWCQLESVYALLALGAVVAAVERRPMLAGILLGAGVMVKVQAVVVAPVVGLVILAEAGRVPRRVGLLALGAILPVALAMGPFVTLGQGGLVLGRIAALVAGPGWLTVNALNAWYLVTGGAGNWAYQAPLTRPDSAPVLVGVSARALGSAALVLWSVGVLGSAWRVRREASGRGWLLAGALLYLGVFLWPTQAHERYAFGAVVMLAGMVAVGLGGRSPDPRPGVAEMGGGEKRGRMRYHPGGTVGASVAWRDGALYAMITAAHTLNLLWAAPPMPWLASRFAGQREIGLGVALVMLLLAWWGWWMLHRMGDGETSE